MRILTLSSTLLIAVLWIPPTSAQQPRQRTDHPPETIRSKWNPVWEGMGISEEIYTTNHLSRLSPEEVQRFAVASYLTGWNDALESVTFKCGPQGKDVDRSTVKLFLDLPDDTPSELSSGIRNRLRTVADVRIVYSTEDADATINMLGLENKARGSGIIFGYTLSFVATRNCTVPVGTRTYPAEFTLATDLETAATVDELVRSVAAEIDTRISEKIRRWNQSARKAAAAPTNQK